MSTKAGEVQSAEKPFLVQKSESDIQLAINPQIQICASDKNYLSVRKYFHPL